MASITLQKQTPALLDAYGRPIPPATKRRRVDARYDAAQTTDANKRHWENADNLSPASANKHEVRRVLRSRARYEIHENNSFAKGIILTIAKDTIRRGPRLRMKTPNKEFNQAIENAFNRWAREVRFAAKLRTMRMSRAVDGEIFLTPRTNRHLRHPVKLDVSLIEGDQVTSLFGPSMLDPNIIDGIHFDEDGNPVLYEILKHHPGTEFPLTSNLFDPDKLRADQVIHYFREDRPGQARGIPEVTPALPLFAQLRRFILATIRAAETAADIAGVVKSQAPPQDPDASDVEPMDTIDLELGSFLTLPEGWDIQQIRSEHPATTFEMFRNAIVSEVARCMLMPFNKALGKSAGYTFASGKLDRDDYIESIEAERDDIECCVLDRVFFWWLDEAFLVPGLLPDFEGAIADLPFGWSWDGFRETDPSKQSQADARLWDVGLMTDQEFLTRRGRDVETHYQELAEQRAARVAMEMPLPGQKDREPAGGDGESDELLEEQAAAEAIAAVGV